MSSGIGRMINKGSMEGTTSSPTIRVEIYNQTYNIRSDGDCAKINLRQLRNESCARRREDG